MDRQEGLKSNKQNKEEGLKEKEPVLDILQNVFFLLKLYLIEPRKNIWR